MFGKFNGRIMEVATDCGQILSYKVSCICKSSKGLRSDRVHLHSNALSTA